MRTQCSPQVVFHWLYIGVPYLSEVVCIGWNRTPLASFCCQVILDRRHLWFGLEYFVEIMKFIWCSLEIGTIVWIYDPWFSPTSDESLQSIQYCFSSPTGDYFDVYCLCGKGNKYSNVPFDYGLATSCFQSECNWPCIIHSTFENWSRWLYSRWWQLSHKLSSCLSLSL